MLSESERSTICHVHINFYKQRDFGFLRNDSTSVATLFFIFFHTSIVFEIMGTISSCIRQDKSRQTLEITRGRGKNRCDEARTLLVFLQIIKRSHSSDMLIAGAPPKTLDVCNVPEDIIIATEKGMMCENLLGRRPDGRLPDGMLRGRTLRRQDLGSNSNANGKLHVRWKGMDA
jgi:hypothetical protein